MCRTFCILVETHLPRERLPSSNRFRIDYTFNSAHFSFMVTYAAPKSKWVMTPDAIKVFELKTGELKRAFPAGVTSTFTWPHFKSAPLELASTNSYTSEALSLDGVMTTCILPVSKRAAASTSTKVRSVFFLPVASKLARIFRCYFPT